jgi:hypothetical protein
MVISISDKCPAGFIFREEDGASRFVQNAGTMCQTGVTFCFIKNRQIPI